MTNKTPLHDLHLQAGARMVDFGGWEMPIHYGSQLEEHHAVRGASGMFDVSHMTVVDLAGERSGDFLRHLLANDVAKLKVPGAALYTCMLNERGGVIDDLIVYRRAADRYRMVVNAATRAKDLAWITGQAEPCSASVAERADLAMVAVQGPQARAKFASLLDGSERERVLAVKRFAAVEAGGAFVARTGYTGEDGFEVVVPGAEVAGWWRRLAAAGVRPCGLGARDTLRLEAGMNLYGQDLDEDTTPLESGLSWTIAWDPPERDFIGRAALERERERGPARAQVGLTLEDRGVLRHGQDVYCERGQGVVTSGSFSPTLSRSIALARVPSGTAGRVEVEIRGKRLAARVVAPPWVKGGKPVEH